MSLVKLLDKSDRSNSPQESRIGEILGICAFCGGDLVIPSSAGVDVTFL